MKPETFAKRFPELSSSLAPDDLEAVIGAFELHDADAGEALVAEGTTTDELFLVWDGELAITMSGPAGVRPLAGVAPGSYFGEASLLDPGPAEASVVSEQGCVALRMSRARFDAICDSNPRAARSWCCNGVSRAACSATTHSCSAPRARARSGNGRR